MTPLADQRLWSVGAAVAALLPASATAGDIRGVTGAFTRSASLAPTLTDVSDLILPGLAALRIRATIVPLPEDDALLCSLLHERLRRGQAVPALAFESGAEVEPDAQDADVASDHSGQLPAWLRGSLLRQTLAVSVDRSSACIGTRNRNGRPLIYCARHLRRRYSHVVLVGRASRTGGRSRNLWLAALRWAAAVAAFPERAPAPHADDGVLRDAAAYLAATAGAWRGPAWTRLRRTAAQFGAARTPRDVDSAFRALTSAALVGLGVSPAAHAALLVPPDRSLGPIDRQELIYLARAGTRDIAVLAGRRLAFTPEHADVRATLDQLALHPHIWIRAAARYPGV